MIAALLGCWLLGVAAHAEEDAPPVTPDRSGAPDVAPAVALELPEPQLFSPRPGLQIALVHTAGMRQARVSLMFRRGSRQMSPESSASYDAFGWVWDQATQRRSGEALAIFEDVTDIDVWSTSGLDRTNVHLDAPVDRLDEGLGLLREVVLEPRFVRKDLKAIRESRLRWWLVEAPTDGGALIEGGLDHLWVPEEHPLSSRPDVGGWNSLTKREVRAHHEALLAEAPLLVLVVGDLTEQDVNERILPALEGLGVAGEVPQPEPFTPPKTTQVLGINLYGTGRASLGLRYAAPTLEHEDAAAFRLIDHAMGGHFLSRLNRDLREERGLTYGIDSSFASGKSAGTWTVMTEVSVEDAKEAITAIRAQIDQVAAAGITRDELDDGVRNRTRGWNGTFASISRAAGAYGSRLRLGWTVAAARARLAAYGAVTPDQSQQVAARWLGADAPRGWVIVGEKGELEGPLKELGLEVQWLPGELVVLGRGVAPVPEEQGQSD